jgi:hypothetical protein
MAMLGLAVAGDVVGTQGGSDDEIHLTAPCKKMRRRCSSGRTRMVSLPPVNLQLYA